MKLFIFSPRDVTNASGLVGVIATTEEEARALIAQDDTLDFYMESKSRYEIEVLGQHDAKIMFEEIHLS